MLHSKNLTFAKLNSNNSIVECILTSSSYSYNTVNNVKHKTVDNIFDRPATILLFELKNDDIEHLISGDVLLIKRNIQKLQNYQNHPLYISRWS